MENLRIQVGVMETIILFSKTNLLESFHCNTFGQSYCRNKVVQFFCPTVYWDICIYLYLCVNQSKSTQGQAFMEPGRRIATYSDKPQLKCMLKVRFTISFKTSIEEYI